MWLDEPGTHAFDPVNEFPRDFRVTVRTESQTCTNTRVGQIDSTRLVGHHHLCINSLSNIARPRRLNEPQLAISTSFGLKNYKYSLPCSRRPGNLEALQMSTLALSDSGWMEEAWLRRVHPTWILRCPTEAAASGMAHKPYP